MSTTLRAALTGLAASTAIAAGGLAAGSAPALASEAHLQRVTSSTYKVTVSFPASWAWVPDAGAGSFSYDGASGFIFLTAGDESGGLRHTCRDAAVGGALGIFGKHPHITFRKIDGRPGCVIAPSRNAPRDQPGPGGRRFQIAEALVAYRHAITSGGVRFPLLLISADPGHIKAVVDSARLHH
jgi:hypothetical protein